MTTGTKDPRSAAIALPEAAKSLTQAIEQFVSLLGEEVPAPTSPPRRSFRRSTPSLAYAKTYPRITSDAPWEERALRQALIVNEIMDRGGSVPKAEWYEVAAMYGYQGRGLAGFFRKTGKGLLIMKGNQVTVTPHGRRRLKDFAAQVKLEQSR